MHLYSFEKLDVWQEARKFAVSIYKLTNTFPTEEKFGLANQLRRAAISIASNIAEGASRKSAKDQAHFYHLAYGSLIEVLSQLIISHDLGYILGEQLIETRLEIESLSRKLSALKNAVLNPKL